MMKHYKIKAIPSVFCRYEFLDSVDGLYGLPTEDYKDATGMIGMVMRGVCIVVKDSLMVG